MELIEQKKRALEWLGYRTVINPEEESLMPFYYTFGAETRKPIYMWNPQDNDTATCKQWQEIWENMDDQAMLGFLLKLEDIVNISSSFNYERMKGFVTSTPSKRWEALNLMLDEILTQG